MNSPILKGVKETESIDVPKIKISKSSSLQSFGASLDDDSLKQPTSTALTLDDWEPVENNSMVADGTCRVIPAKELETFKASIDIPENSNDVALFSQIDPTALNHTRTSISLPKDFDMPDLDEILSNSRKYPFSRESYRAFLATMFAQELFDCWINIKVYRDRFLFNIAFYQLDADADVVLSCGPNATMKDVASAIVSEFFLEEAPREVSLSAKWKTSAKDIVKVGTFTPSCFDEHMNEIERWMSRNLYLPFFKHVTESNISKKESNIRLGMAAIFLGASFIGLGILNYYETIGYVKSPFWRLLFTPTILYGVLCYDSWRRQLCVWCVDHDLSSVNTDLSLVDAMKENKVEKITDNFALSRLRRTGNRMKIQGLGFTLLIMLGVMLLPPNQFYTW